MAKGMDPSRTRNAAAPSPPSRGRFGSVRHPSRLTVAVAALSAAAMVASHAGAYWLGWSGADDRWQARVDALTAARQMDAARIDGLSEALERGRAAREAGASEMEARVRADPAADDVCLPAHIGDDVLSR